MLNALGSQRAAPLLVGIALIFLVLADVPWEYFFQPHMSFVRRNGTHFTIDGKPFYVNGWNSYWLMAQSMDYDGRSAVKTVLRNGAQMGLSVCRTWAFYDGVHGLQSEPGHYSEYVFKALDYVIVEARRQGVRLLLSLVNNQPEFGGKGQYVEWAHNAGVQVGSSNDSFFSDPIIRGYYKQYIKKIFTRVNSINGVAYRDEPGIFGWELINEPRCQSDPSGDMLQNWIDEMVSYAKSLDQNHLLTIGHEGFYGHSSPEKLERNPGDWVKDLGSDFIRNSKSDLIDFSSVHLYPDMWTPNLKMEEKIKYGEKWVAFHIKDASEVLQKPVLFSEFGVSDQVKGFDVKNRVDMFEMISGKIYESAEGKDAGAGAFIWQFVVEDLHRYQDEFAVIPWREPILHEAIIRHSCRLSNITGNYDPNNSLCSGRSHT